MSRPDSRAVCGLALLLSVMSPVLLPGQEIPPGSDRWNRAALEWIGSLKAGSFQEAGARVDPAVPEGAMGPEQLQTIWGQLSAQLGALRLVRPGPVSQQGAYHVVDLPATFENQSVVLRVVLSESLLIGGFFVQPAEPPPYDPPGYVKEGSVREVDVTVGAEPWVLPGVLTLPEAVDPTAAVVLVHGSGPNDRDETIGGSRPFRDLAWGLASQGIAVLRYDKRTRVYGPEIPADIGLDDEVIEDALAALEVARRRPEIDSDRVFLLGHSLGGILAPEIGKRDGKVAGIAVLAASARPFFEVLTGQLEYIASLEPDSNSSARAQLDSLVMEIRKIEAGEPVEDRAILGAPPAYWREVAAVDPVAVAAELSVPLLVLQGGRDYQSTEEDFSLWVSGLGGKAGFSSKLYPELNHLLAPGEGMATPEEYVSRVSHVAEEVILDLAAWVGGGE